MLIFYYLAVFIEAGNADKCPVEAAAHQNLNKMSKNDKKSIYQVLSQIVWFSTVFFCAGIIVNLLFFMKTTYTPLIVVNVASMVIFLIIALLYRCRRISPNMAILVHVLTISVNLAYYNIYAALYMDDVLRAMESIYINMCIFLALGILSAIIKYRHLPAIISVLGVASYIAAVIIIGDDQVFNAFLILILVFIATPVVLTRVLNATRSIDRENMIVIQERQELLRLLAIEPEHIDLIRGSNFNRQEAAELVDRMDASMREVIVSRVKDSIRTDEKIRSALVSACPSLTGSELEICCSIIDGKTVSEICEARHVSPSTVTSVRSHIRYKMGLKRGDSLRPHLLSLVNRYDIKNT